MFVVLLSTNHLCVYRCLVQNDWDYDKAAKAFGELQVRLILQQKTQEVTCIEQK